MENEYPKGGELLFYGNLTKAEADALPYEKVARAIIAPTDTQEVIICGRRYGTMSDEDKERMGSTALNLGEFERSKGGEDLAATKPYCSDPNILMMKYTIKGAGVAVIYQTVNEARSTQFLVLAGQWFTRYISFTDASRENIMQVTAWWRTMPTNVDYNAETHRVRLVDYNRQHSLPENKATDGFVIPSATTTIDGLMSKEDKQKLNSVKEKVIVDTRSATYNAIRALLDSGKEVFVNKGSEIYRLIADFGGEINFAGFGYNNQSLLYIRYNDDGTIESGSTHIGDSYELKIGNSVVEAVNEVYDYTHEQQKQFHVLIDYNGSLAPIEIKGNRAEVVCRYTANSYEGAAPTTIFKPACRCTVEGEAFEEYSVKMYNQASMSEESRIYPSMDGTVEIAQGVTIWVKFSVKLDYRVLGQTLSFAAGCAFSNFEAAPMTKREKVLAYVDEEAVDFVHNGGKVTLHTQSAGKPLSIHGKQFASDFRYALKVESDCMETGSDYGITVAMSPKADTLLTISKRETKENDALVVMYNKYTFEVPLA